MEKNFDISQFAFPIQFVINLAHLLFFISNFGCKYTKIIDNVGKERIWEIIGCSKKDSDGIRAAMRILGKTLDLL